jgi:ferric-dicitrate binding protein FerR (iron transport regulator)
MDKHFHDLLTRYVAGKCTEDEVALVNRWYEEIEDRDLEVGDDQKTIIRARILENIQRGLPGRNSIFPKQRFLRLDFLSNVAASILTLAICYVWFFRESDTSPAMNMEQALATSDVVVLENRTESIKLFTLPDGSTVKLESPGRINYSKSQFHDQREVYLTGKAFFNIEKDPARPFYVYSGKIATRVLGTSFFVDAPADATKVAVKVVTGRVSVFPISHDGATRGKPSTVKNSTANGVVLSPNQKVDYFVEEGHWVIGLVEEPLPIKPIDEETFSFVFENATIKDVLEKVSERYGIEVVTENEKIHDCTFTGDVSRMSLYDMLDVISNSIGSTYEVKGTRILVSGKGCN